MLRNGTISYGFIGILTKKNLIITDLWVYFSTSSVHSNAEKSIIILKNKNELVIKSFHTNAAVLYIR